MIADFQVYWEAKADHDLVESTRTPEQREAHAKAAAAKRKAEIVKKMT